MVIQKNNRQENNTYDIINTCLLYTSTLDFEGLRFRFCYWQVPNIPTSTLPFIIIYSKDQAPNYADLLLFNTAPASLCQLLVVAIVGQYILFCLQPYSFILLQILYIINLTLITIFFFQSQRHLTEISFPRLVYGGSRSYLKYMFHSHRKIRYFTRIRCKQHISGSFIFSDCLQFIVHTCFEIRIFLFQVIINIKTYQTA